MAQKNNITDVGCNECTGCGACYIICPQKCISFNMNEQGFYTPIVNESDCIDCGLCKEVCYKYLEDDRIETKAVFKGKRVIAAVNNYFDQMRTVTSAGVASRLSSYYFNKGYNVCGVIFDTENDECKHVVAKTNSDLAKFKGSKYLQSNPVSALSSLANSKKNLVFGSPCQIYGLRKYIQKGKIEEQYILVDLFCRGIPTHLLWKAYKLFIQKQFGLDDFISVNFRDKSNGWHKFSMKIIDKKGNEYIQNVFNDMFYSFYIKNACFNKSCYGCKFRHDLAYSDIRLGDFWGKTYNSFDDGVGLVIPLTKIGEEAWTNVESCFRHVEHNTDDIFKSQRINKIKIPEFYNSIIDSLCSGMNLEDIHSLFVVNKK